MGHFSKADLAIRDVAAHDIPIRQYRYQHLHRPATMDFVNETMRSLGLKNTLLRRKMMDIEAAKRGTNAPRPASDTLVANRRGTAFRRASPKTCSPSRV